MNYHILGLFPEMLDHYFSQSLLGKAREKELIAFTYHQLRDWAVNKHHAVDDKPYGGGAGMVFLPEVVCRSVRDLKEKHSIERVVLTSPSGKLLTPAKAKELSSLKSVLFLCGRYEGVDQRAIDLVVDEEISIGDYIISGGELATAVIIDAVTRYIPGVVGKDQSVRLESHEDVLLEHPHYTRPEVFENMSVPDVLMSGHHQKIADWQKEMSIARTKERRPDLYEKYLDQRADAPTRRLKEK
ncbi:MAG: tRNA (guanosine(37)-N1)-methyltransferase TrmD [bacterium]|nr:tRNA (guanosine(37)-N1)-methyltransferase TrmD [bacterium]MBU1918059.1 tRNA (guanosine(37)-N1)-methyltransferase TrmD [bacterium]